MSLISTTTASVVSAAQFPKAAFVPSPAFGVVGSVVKLDARPSSDPDGKPLSYQWRFVSVPIGSQVVGEGFRTLDVDSNTNSPSLVSFSPDIVGEYVVGLVVSNGVFDSAEVTNLVRIRAILVPHGRGVIPDGKFIWSYIRDVWSQVDGKEWFETLWSALIQIVGSEMLKLYQVDFNKSIRNIQDRYQRRWLSYEPRLALTESDLSFFLGNHAVGMDASTINLGLEGQAIILSSSEVVVVVGARLQNVAGESFTILYSRAPENVGTFELTGLNTSRTGYRLSSPSLNPSPDRVATGLKWVFDAGSTTWTLEGSTSTPLAETLSEWAPLSDSLLPLFGASSGSLTDVLRGDVIHYPSGPNAGFYRILEKSGSYVVVDKIPPSAGDPTQSYSSNVYRPVGFQLTQPAITLTNTLSVPYVAGQNDLSTLAPGRVLVVGGQAFKILRSAIDQNQAFPVVVVTVENSELLAGLRGLNWRAPNTLLSSSQNFEKDGVSTGDLLVLDIVHVETGASSEFRAQVVGVRDNALGFVLTDGPVPAGQIPEIPASAIAQLASDFGIDGVSIGQDGSITYAGTALAFYNSINSGVFKRKYWNTELTPTSELSVNPLFQIKPKYIIRNRMIPVDSDLRSVPVLQDWIKQPVLSERNGKLYQSVRGREFEIARRPIALTENLDFLIDDEFVFVGQMTINTGSDMLQVDDGDFVDRGMVQGDQFIIDAPLTLAGTYTIEKVISNTELKLTRSIPAYVLGQFTIADVSLRRKKTGHFLRFVPGLFTAQNPAPDRLWAEVSFFDNNQSIEDNFGLLVGLKKDTLESVSKDINYRQAVSGLMYAFTKGSALDKVRLGAQILLGLPFAEHRGIIRSIEPDYRLDINGVPTLGRLLIEDVDSSGRALGTLRIYTYPIDAASALAGVDTNPATGKTYVVGDVVELFAPLSKGVEIIDYISNPLDASFSAISQLQKFHTVRLRANDNIFSLNELVLVSDFLKKITPSYVAYSLITASEFADTVSIRDLLTAGLGSGSSSFVDNASLGLAATMMFDSKSPDGFPQILVEDGVLWVRRIGSDLAMTDGSATVSSASGGFLNPKANEDFEGPLTLPGDVLIVLDGVNQGKYDLSSVPGDSQITVASPPSLGFETETGLRFAIARRVTGLMAAGTASVTSSNPSVVFDGVPQLRSKGVAPGDWLIMDDGSFGYRFLVKSVKESAPGSGVWDRVDVTPTPNFTDSLVPFEIYRPALISLGTFSVYSNGTHYLDASANRHLHGVLDIGDELVTDLPSQQRVTVLDPRAMYVTPALPVGTYDVTVAKRNRPVGPIGWDHIEKFDPINSLDMTLLNAPTTAAFSASSQIVTLTPVDPLSLGALPGDLFVISSGINSTVDVGQGPGVYPIVEVTSTTVKLSVQLGATGTSSWKIIRRR